MGDHENWWGAVDDETLRCLAAHGPMSPAELGKHLGMSEGGAASLVAQLAREGKVRICLVASAAAWTAGAIDRAARACEHPGIP